MNDLPTAESANLHFVTPQLAVGGDLNAFDDTLASEQLDDLLRLGITHVLDVRLEWDDAQTFAERAPHVRYLHHGMDDAGQAVPPEWFERVAGWAEDAYREDPDAVVLAHCHMGINRGPSVGFAILLALGWDAVEAIAAVRRARPVANVWYAADALSWHQQRTGADADTAAAQHAALVAWREENPLDVVRVIREQRERGH